MQQTPQRELPERMSWARAMVFAMGFFFLAAILIGQLPGYVNLEMTAASLASLEQGALALAAIGLAGFIIIQVIALLFDPKPVVPPRIFVGLGLVLAIAGLALIGWSTFTVHTIGHTVSNNQYFPQPDSNWNPLLGGNFLWLQPDAIDFVMIGFVVLTIGLAMLFYGWLATREQRNPDRSDSGTTFGIRVLLTIGIVLLTAFAVFYLFVSDRGLAYKVDPQCPILVDPAHGCSSPITGLLIVDTILNFLLGIAVFCTLGAFALRLHYLMRPVRKRTMSVLYLVGINLAPFGVVFLLVWLLAYPVVDWIHSWTFIGLGNYLTICGKPSAIPASCAFSQQAGYIVDTLITTGTFVLFMAAIWAWRSHRNLVIIGGVTVTAVLALATLLTHLHPDEELIAMLLCGGALTFAVVWTSAARREFAVIGEKNLGCLGQWLIVGTCLLIYFAAFGFFSIPGLIFHDTEPNIPFNPGVALPDPASSNAQPDAIVTLLILGVLAAIQFYFLVRNRYKA